jgi:hypothetical protein
VLVFRTVFFATEDETTFFTAFPDFTALITLSPPHTYSPPVLNIKTTPPPFSEHQRGVAKFPF